VPPFTLTVVVFFLVDFFLAVFFFVPPFTLTVVVFFLVDFFLAVFFFVPPFTLTVVIFFLADFLLGKAASQPAAYLLLEPMRKMVMIFPFVI